MMITSRYIYEGEYDSNRPCCITNFSSAEEYKYQKAIELYEAENPSEKGRLYICNEAYYGSDDPNSGAGIGRRGTLLSGSKALWWKKGHHSQMKRFWEIFDSVPIFQIEIELYPNSESPKKPYFWILRWNHGKDWCNFNAGWAATPEEAWADGYKYWTDYCRREAKWHRSR